MGGGKGMALMGLGAASAGLGQCRGSMSGNGKGVGPGDGMGQYNANAPHDVNRTDSPTRIKTQHYDTKITGQQGNKGDAYSVQIIGEPDQPGKAKVPYYKVYSDYSKAAEHALDKDNVPPTYRTRVRDYFDSLKPATK
jgi:hypothetical protein